MKNLYIAIIGFFVAFLVLSGFEVSGSTRIFTAGGVAAVLFLMFFSGDSKNSVDPRVAAGFNSDFKHENIAIDLKAAKLWMRDGSGKSTIVERDKILRWNLAFNSLGTVHTKSRIEIHINDLAQPLWFIPFDKSADMLKAGARQNYAEAEEWISRLTTWKNNS